MRIGNYSYAFKLNMTNFDPYDEVHQVYAITLAMSLIRYLLVCLHADRNTDGYRPLLAR